MVEAIAVRLEAIAYRLEAFVGHALFQEFAPHDLGRFGGLFQRDVG